MSTTSDPSEPQRKPRLSLQIKAISHPRQSVRASRTLAAAIDPKSPTSFNTLSNVYVTAIERSTPEPVTAIKARPSLRVQTQDAVKEQQLRTPYLGPNLDTPQSAHPASPSFRNAVVFPSAAMTATPPMSAGAVESNAPQPYFAFNIRDMTKEALLSPGTPRRRTTFPAMPSIINPPYTHPRTLHSILRNSPLPPITARSPDTPRRRSARLQEKALRRVAYNSPLEETITTQTYVRTHVDLLTDDPSPFSPYNAAEDPEKVLDQTMAYTGNETRDGGQTPGPFEEMRRRMAGLNASSPISPTGGGGIRKKTNRKWKEKKRQWVWTIGTDPDDEDAGSPLVPATAKPLTAVPKLSVPVKAAAATGQSVPIIAIPAPRTRSRAASLSVGKAMTMMVPMATPAKVPEVPALVLDTSSSHSFTPQSSMEPPTPSVETVDEARVDVEMSNTYSFVSEIDHHSMALEMDLDVDTPVAVKSSSAMAHYGSRLSSVDSLGPSEPGGMRKDTPVPADFVMH